MFFLFFSIACIGGAIVGRSISDGDPVMAFIGVLIGCIGIAGNAGVFA